MSSSHLPTRLLSFVLASGSAFLPVLSAQTSSASDSEDQEEVIALSQFEVTADQDSGYASTNAVGGTRFNTAIVNVPQSVIVLNQELMEDIGALSVIDAAQYVSGVSTTAGPNREVFNVRGYGVGVTTDGLPDSSPTGQGLSTPFELLERVEIIKGPSAVLYGSTSPGGNVNRITKKPLFEDRTELTGSAGNRGFYRGVFDANKVLDENVAVRVIGSHEYADYTGNFEDSSSWFIAPMVGSRMESTNPKHAAYELTPTHYGYRTYSATWGRLKAKP
ncbi:MAG: TonB-dependent siderophore receptor [Opitutaceae bacterium]